MHVLYWVYKTFHIFWDSCHLRGRRLWTYVCGYTNARRAGRASPAR
jgi:hypothetical protein